MKPKAVAVVVAALVLGGIGYWIGVWRGSPKLRAPACAGTAMIEYDARSQKFKVIGNSSLGAEILLVEFSRLSGAFQDVCWDLSVVNEGTKLKKVEIDTKPPVGSDNRTPILVGKASFPMPPPSQTWLRYSGAKPVWSTVNINGALFPGLQWKFSVRGELVDGRKIELDPEIVIKKGG